MGMFFGSHGYFYSGYSSFLFNQVILFAQVSYLAADSLFPEWKVWTQFLDQITEGLRLDCLEESHPIEVKRC